MSDGLTKLGEAARRARAAISPWNFFSPTDVAGFAPGGGIPGIKYLDAGSRSAGDGSRNYVVFDDKLVEIVKKYGWAPGMAIPAAMALELQQAQEQSAPQM